MRSGSMHLFAISGLNIGVIAIALNALLALGRVTRGPRFVLAATLLWVFVDITGASPSAVRAWLMATFLQAAFVFGRPGNVLAALAASAAASVAVAPLQVFTMFALACSAGSFLLVLILAGRRLIIGPEEGGLFTLFGILFFLVSVTMVGIGLIGEYVGRTYQVVRARQRYHVRETLETAGAPRG